VRRPDGPAPPSSEDKPENLRLCGLRRAWHRRLGQRRSRRRPDSDPPTEPVRAARQIVDQGFTPRYDYALQTLSENFYAKWRDYDAEDTLRFYALRLQEVGPIKSSRQKIMADGTDWRFFNELKRELKA